MTDWLDRDGVCMGGMPLHGSVRGLYSGLLQQERARLITMGVREWCRRTSSPGRDFPRQAPG